MKKLLIALFYFLSISLHAQSTESSRIQDFVCEWLGVKYKFGGTKKETGVDCSYLVKTFYKTVFDRNIERVAKSQWKQTKRISKHKLVPGDLVFFNSKNSPSGWHVGVFIGDNKFLHAANCTQGVIISDLCETSYQKNYKGAGRL